MKSVITEESTTKDLPFPKLMQLHPRKHSEAIVLMYNENGNGNVVYSDYTTLPVGMHQEKFNMSKFKDFQGTLTLSND